MNIQSIEKANPRYPGIGCNFHQEWRISFNGEERKARNALLGRGFIGCSE